ncbi:hypothetical protein ACF0H5_023542 [Mactra antiquata]
MSSRRGSEGTKGRGGGGGASQGVSTKMHNVKLVLLGDVGVGKSSIALRFVRGEFTDNTETTVGAAFLTQTVSVSAQSIKFDIWDTAGQERYHSLAPMYYRGAQAAVVVYDVCSQKSFQKAVSWVKELRQQANSQIIMVLAGNKADMAADKRAVHREDAQAFADDNGMFFTETSAKTGMCVGDVFMAIAQKLASHRQIDHIDGPSSLKLGSDSGKEKKSGCC